MRKSLFLLAFLPLLGGCLGPAPWADWKTGAIEPSKAASPAPWSDWKSANRSAATGAVSSAPSEGVTYRAQPKVETAEIEPITAPPPELMQTASAAPATTSSMDATGGPYAPLEIDPKTTASQPLKLRASGQVRTLPLVMSGTGAKIH